MAEADAASEAHRRMKRRERRWQLETVARDTLAGPPARCRYRTATGGETWVLVRIVAVYQGGFACVRAVSGPAQAAPDHPFWLVRDGVDWEGFLRSVTLAYRMGRKVAAPFAPRMKLPPDLVENLASLPASDLPAAFGKLREAGFLSPLPPLAPDTCPPQLGWKAIRAGFQDFRPGNGEVT